MPQYGAQWVTSQGTLTNQAYNWLNKFAVQSINTISNPGIVVFDGQETIGRTLTPGSNRMAISNGDGIKGNPTIDVNEQNLEVSATQITGASIAAGSILNGSSTGINTGDQVIIPGSGIDVLIDGSKITIININAVYNLINYTYFGGM